MDKFDKHVLCIPTEALFAQGKWDGLQTRKLDSYYELLLNKSEFRRRGDLEEDVSFKQIIPQIILTFENRYFLHFQNNVTDTRLSRMYPLPLGGHVEKFDRAGKNDLIQTALNRELHEEVRLGTEIINREFLGLIYIEDENPVNHVHVGVCYIFELDGEDVEMNEDELEKVGFVTKNYLYTHQTDLTYWSKVVLPYL